MGKEKCNCPTTCFCTTLFFRENGRSIISIFMFVCYSVVSFSYTKFPGPTRLVKKRKRRLPQRRPAASTHRCAEGQHVQTQGRAASLLKERDSMLPLCGLLASSNNGVVSDDVWTKQETRKVDEQQCRSLPLWSARASRRSDIDINMKWLDIYIYMHTYIERERERERKIRARQRGAIKISEKTLIHVSDFSYIWGPDSLTSFFVLSLPLTLCDGMLRFSSAPYKHYVESRAWRYVGLGIYDKERTAWPR